MPGFPIHHQLLEFTQNHGHQVILRPSAFFIVQLSHPYMTTEKTKALTRRTFVGKVTSLLFNMLSRLVIAFIPRSKWLLLLWMQSLFTVTLEPKKIKVCYCFHFFPPSFFHEVMGMDVMIFILWMLSFKPAFNSPLSPSPRSSLVPFHFLP